MKYQGDQDLEDIDSKLEDQMSSIFQEKYSEAKVLGAVLFAYQSQDLVFISSLLVGLQEQEKESQPGMSREVLRTLIGYLKSGDYQNAARYAGLEYENLLGTLS